MALFGKNKNVNVVCTFTIAFDKSDSSYTGYKLKGDRDDCVDELEKADAWSIDTLELDDEPAKNSVEPSSVKVKSIKLLNYPVASGFGGHQHSGVFKYYVDTPTRGMGRIDRLWLSGCKATVTEQKYDGCNKSTKIHTLKIKAKVTAKLIIQENSKG